MGARSSIDAKSQYFGAITYLKTPRGWLIDEVQLDVEAPEKALPLILGGLGGFQGAIRSFEALALPRDLTVSHAAYLLYQRALPLGVIAAAGSRTTRMRLDLQLQVMPLEVTRRHYQTYLGPGRLDN